MEELVRRLQRLAVQVAHEFHRQSPLATHVDSQSVSLDSSTPLRSVRNDIGALLDFGDYVRQETPSVDILQTAPGDGVTTNTVNLDEATVTIGVEKTG